MVCLPALVELVQARRWRHHLAAAYAAANARLDETFLRNRKTLVGSAALLLAAYLPGLDILA